MIAHDVSPVAMFYYVKRAVAATLGVGELVGGAKRAKRAISVKAAPPSRHFPGKGWSGWGSVLVFLFYFSF